MRLSGYIKVLDPEVIAPCCQFCRRGVADKTGFPFAVYHLKAHPGMNTLFLDKKLSEGLLILNLPVQRVLVYADAPKVKGSGGLPPEQRHRQK